jgi:ABC-type multidrug transport system fused ATPase/permease subunit
LLYRYLRPYWRRTLALTVILLSAIGLQLLNPQILRGFIDAAKEQADNRQLVYAALTFLGVGMLVHLLNLLNTYLSTDLGFAATNALRSDLAEHCLSLDMDFHNDRTPGEIIERIDGDVTHLTNFFTQFVIQLLGSGLLIIGVLALLYREDWRVGLALTGFAGLSLFIMLRLRDVGVEDSAAERQASADLFGFLEERLDGLDDIRANGSNAYTMRRLYERMRDLYEKGRRAWTRRSVVWRTVMTMFGLGQVLALGLGAYYYRREVMTIGTVYLLLHYTQMLFHPLEHIAHQLQDLQKAAAAIGRIRELFDLHPEILDGAVERLPLGALPLAFDGVQFSYGDGELVLDDLTFNLAPGTRLGLLGRTGSGKTTLTRLLFRLYEPSTGAIRLGEHDLRDLRLSALRKHVAMVTQEVQLFRGTVRDNLTFFDPDVPDDKIVQVLRELGMGEWYDSLENGLDTEVATGGDDLSAGEAQLLAFARAFMGDPGLVILDEPSSRLDPATERRLEQAMNRLLEGRTGIIIAHRLQTVERVDEIMIMQGGRIAEHGRRDDLVADPDSRFSGLLQTGLEEAFA